MSTAKATAVSIFHRPAGADGLDRWLADLMASGRAADGCVDALVSIHDDPYLVPALAVTFRTERQLHDWLDSTDRKNVLEDGESRGFWRQSSDLVLVEGETKPSGIDVFRHSVGAGKESDFQTAQVKLTEASSRFPGYEGTVVFPPDASGEWMSLIRFRTEHQLSEWLKSQERDESLRTLRPSLTRDFTALSQTTPFGTMVRIEDGKARMTPDWKTAMLILMVLYPTVMLLSRFLGPVLDRWGAQPWLALWLSQVVSVSVMQWSLMPAVSARFRRWLDPVDGAGLRISLRGAAAVVAVYAVTLLVFATVRWLQYWDYG